MSLSPDLSIVIVHYRTPELVGPCVAALRQDLEAAGLTADWWLVDNGSEEGDRQGFEDLGLQRLDPGSNLGYAGGVNRGVHEAAADRWVIMNPDVLVRPGCLPRLLAALEDGYFAAGPRFVWDSGGRLVLPPNEPRRRGWELRASLAPSSPRWARRAREVWRKHARHHWSAREVLPSFELSGALLALRRDAWEKVGPFDDGYPLYFEETDWLHRLRRSGGRAAYVPTAEAVHLYDQSARREPRATAWFEESRRRFQARHYGRWFVHLIERIEAWASSSAIVGTPRPAESGAPRLILKAAGPVWVEVSPREVGFPAAAQFLEDGGEIWQLPADVWDRLGPGTYWLREVDTAGKELACESFTKASSSRRA